MSPLSTRSRRRCVALGCPRASAGRAESLTSSLARSKLLAVSDSSFRLFSPPLLAALFRLPPAPRPWLPSPLRGSATVHAGPKRDSAALWSARRSRREQRDGPPLHFPPLRFVVLLPGSSSVTLYTCNTLARDSRWHRCGVRRIPDEGTELGGSSCRSPISFRKGRRSSQLLTPTLAKHAAPLGSEQRARLPPILESRYAPPG